MNVDPGLICFIHCNRSIICDQLPDVCPLCKLSLTSSSVMPFRIPYPFVRAKQIVCAIVMKPSTGSFLSCYSINSDLHVGITSSSGEVFEFDLEGLNNSNTDAWNQCLIIYQIKDSAWYRRWDDVLRVVFDQYKFSANTYDEITHNCYSFVLTFVRELRHSDFEKTGDSKEIFCQSFVIPRLKDACKYVSQFRNVKDCGFHVNS